MVKGLSNPIRILGSDGNDIWADTNQYELRTQILNIGESWELSMGRLQPLSPENPKFP